MLNLAISTYRSTAIFDSHPPVSTLVSGDKVQPNQPVGPRSWLCDTPSDHWFMRMVTMRLTNSSPPIHAPWDAGPTLTMEHFIQRVAGCPR